LWKGWGLFGEIYKGMDRAEDGDCLREVGGKHQRFADRAGQSRHGPAEREPSQPERPLRPFYFAIFIITMAPGRLWGSEKFRHRNSLEIFLTYSFFGGTAVRPRVDTNDVFSTDRECMQPFSRPYSDRGSRQKPSQLNLTADAKLTAMPVGQLHLLSATRADCCQKFYKKK
jgi:hypothetical protein